MSEISRTFVIAEKRLNNRQKTLNDRRLLIAEIFYISFRANNIKYKSKSQKLSIKKSKSHFPHAHKEFQRSFRGSFSNFRRSI